jgi:hypothetical protein
MHSHAELGKVVVYITAEAGDCREAVQELL